MNGIRIHKAFWPSAQSKASWNCGHFRGRGKALGIGVMKGCSSNRRSQFNSSNHQCKPKHFADIDLRPTIDTVYRVNWFMLKEKKQPKKHNKTYSVVNGCRLYICPRPFARCAFYLGWTTPINKTWNRILNLVDKILFSLKMLFSILPSLLRVTMNVVCIIKWQMNQYGTDIFFYSAHYFTSVICDLRWYMIELGMT